MTNWSEKWDEIENSRDNSKELFKHCKELIEMMMEYNIEVLKDHRRINEGMLALSHFSDKSIVEWLHDSRQEVLRKQSMERIDGCTSAMETFGKLLDEYRKEDID